MSTTTARLGLVKPATSGEVVDISIINDNMDDLDAAVGFTVCTSGTRPSTPYTGQQIHETDTDNRYYWSGSYWRGIGVLTCTSGARPANQRAGQVIFETDTGRVLTYDGTTWNTGRCYAHMGKTDGFQSMTTTPTVVTMAAAQILEGGFTFDDAADALVVPITGNYRVTVRGYVSGSLTYTATIAAKIVGGATIVSALVQKPYVEDVTGEATRIYTLTAGDKICVEQTHSAVAGNSYGTDGSGTALILEFLGV